MVDRTPCPKCGSQNTSFTNTTPIWGKFPDGVEFSCMMCGQRLYGQKALDWVGEKQTEMQRQSLTETLRQQEARRLLEAKGREASLRLQVSVLRAETLEAKLQANPKEPLSGPAPLKVSEAPQEAPKIDPKQRKREREAARRLRIRMQKLEAKIREPEKCCWSGCSNPRVGKSKYCSKKCSNKVSHAAEKQRKIAKASQTQKGAETFPVG